MHKSDRDISRVQRQIRPVYAELKNTLSPIKEPLIAAIKGDTGRIMKAYQEADSREEQTRLKKEYIRVIKKALSNKAYTEIEKQLLKALQDADEKAMEIIERLLAKNAA